MQRSIRLNGLALVWLCSSLFEAFADMCPNMASWGAPSAAAMAQARRLQLRLAMGNQPDSMLISWNSPNTSVPGLVQVRLCSEGEPLHLFSGTTAEGSSCYTVGSTVHSVEVDGLLPGTQYYYGARVEPGEWSEWMSFRTPSEKLGVDHTFAVIGDLGVTFGGPVTRALASAVEAEGIQMVVHNGDVGYADSEIKPSNGTRYQDFLDYHYENTSVFASRIPYMLMPGNHEAPCNFQEFTRRAVRPAMQRGDYYSFTSGAIHFIMLSAEHGQLSGKMDDPQTGWLQNELERALQMKRNGSINWIFTFVHYPKQPFGYCTYNLPFCSTPPDATQEWFEDLFASHEVDIHFAAHQHVYERTFPVHRQQPVFPNASIPAPHPGMFPSGSQDIFNDPPYPVYLVNGAAGDDVVFPQNWLSPPAWSAVNSRTVQFGYTTVRVSPNCLNVSYRVPLEAEPGVQKVFTMDEFSIVKTTAGQHRKATLLRSSVRKAPNMPWSSVVV